MYISKRIREWLFISVYVYSWSALCHPSIYLFLNPRIFLSCSSGSTSLLPHPHFPSFFSVPVPLSPPVCHSGYFAGDLYIAGEKWCPPPPGDLGTVASNTAQTPEAIITWQNYRPVPSRPWRNDASHYSNRDWLLELRESNSLPLMDVCAWARACGRDAETVTGMSLAG